ncbi:hypothetical protein, partial [Bacillus sp. 7894-2]|uniref:hypothetical protein n=1 Tax=Bacillus sp. 7894-2 TaxID=2021695 RepID=UPI001C5294B5
RFSYYFMKKGVELLILLALAILKSKKVPKVILHNGLFCNKKQARKLTCLFLLFIIFVLT